MPSNNPLYRTSNHPLRGWARLMRGLHILDNILRGHAANDSSELESESTPSIRNTAMLVMLLGPIYGLAMGSYAYWSGERTWLEQLPQMAYSGLKVPLLIAVTAAISLPSFFVVNTLLGLRDDFRTALHAIVSAQAGMVAILASLFPLTLFVYVSLVGSDVDYQLAILCNAAMFGLASVSAQLLLSRCYRPLVAKNPRHRWMVRSWIFVYAFVGIQASYVLRPFIGNPDTAISFLREDSFQNAYLRVLILITDVLREII